MDEFKPMGIGVIPLNLTPGFGAPFEPANEAKAMMWKSFDEIAAHHLATAGLRGMGIISIDTGP